MKDDSCNNPKVSIGLPVFNGEEYLQEAIDSILAQTFTDFELVISDNASTDRTEAICKRYAATDARVRYYRNSTNIGAANNENLTFKLSKGEYFRLAAHDDVLAPTLLEKCIDVLEHNPSVVLCYSETLRIDENGNYLELSTKELASSDLTHERFRDLARQHDCEPSYGLTRANVLRKTELQPDYPESDFGFLCEVSLHGKFHLIHEPLFKQRFHSSRISASPDLYKKMKSYRLQSNFGFKANPTQLELLYFHIYYFHLQLSHFFRILSRSPVSLRERLLCYFYALRWLISRLIAETRGARERFFLTKEGWLSLQRKLISIRVEN